MTFRDEGTPLGSRALPAMGRPKYSTPKGVNPKDVRLLVMEKAIAEAGRAETEPGFCKKHGDVRKYVFFKVLKSGAGRVERPCVTCISERDAARYAANREAKKAQNAAYVKANRKAVSVYERLRRRRKRREGEK